MSAESINKTEEMANAVTHGVGAALAVGRRRILFGCVFFFVMEHLKYNHSAWHLFVRAGSTFHFFSVMTLL
jgi:predicted membrane channel-forming protein YqfA (hemolysin III family)